MSSWLTEIWQAAVCRIAFRISVQEHYSHTIIFIYWENTFYGLHLWNKTPSTAITDLHGITANIEFSFQGMTISGSVRL